MVQHVRVRVKGQLCSPAIIADHHPSGFTAQRATPFADKERIRLRLHLRACNQPYLAFAEFERALLRERQREGIALAKQRGAYRGRNKALAPDQITALRARAAAGEPKAHLARTFGISRETLYQYLRTAPGPHVPGAS